MSRMNNAYEPFIRNNLIVLLGQLFIYGQGIIIMPIIIKTMGVDIYGGYILVLSLVGFVFGISSWGVGFRRNRFLPSAPDRQAGIALYFPQFNFQLLNLIFLAIIVIILFPLFDNYLLKGAVAFSAWLVLPYLIGYGLYSQAVEYFRYTHRIKFYNFSTIAFAALNIATILVCYAVNIKLTVNVLFGIQISSSLLVALPLMLLVVKEIGLKVTLPNLAELIKEIKLGAPLVLTYVVDVILNSSDRYLLTAFLSVAAVGYYNPGYALGSLLVMLPKVVSGVVLPPILCKAVDSGNTEEARTLVNYTVRGFLLVAFPFIAGCALMSKPLLTFLANAEVAEKGSLVAVIVALGTLFYGLEVIISHILFVQLKTSAILTINVVAALLNVVLNLVLLYYFPNIVVAAVTTLFTYLVAFIFMYRIVGQYWPIDFGVKIILKSLVASGIMALGLYWLSSRLGANSYRVGYVLGEIGLGIIVYCLALFTLKTFSAREIFYLKKALSFPR